MRQQYHKFDFTNPEPWVYQGGVMTYSSGSDEEADLAEWIMGDMEDANKIDFESDGWLYMAQVDEMVPADSRFRNIRTCDHCGSPFKYGAAFKHSDTGEVAVVGHICAVNTMALSASDAIYKRMQRAEKSNRQRRKADSRIASLAPNRREVLSHQHHIVRDMLSRFRRWGSLSVKQWALAKKIAFEGAARQAQRDAENTMATCPVPTGRVEICGEVVGTKVVQGGHYYAPSVLKLIVRDDRGFKVYGTAASALCDHDVGKGCGVRFTATIERARDDEYFGFFKRPSKAEVTYIPAA